MRLWPRVRLDVGWSDLAAGALACVRTPGRPALLREAASYWSNENTVVCFSVRSGFDLLLQALDLRRDDEVIFSSINVKGMVNIVKRADLITVPLDIDISTVTPPAQTLKSAISPKSKVLVIAHLFGCRLELDGLIDAAHEAGLVVVEDCAQAFNGQEYSGHPKADVCMFSFGPIKTSTALGGALVNVRDRALYAKMLCIQDNYPVQPTSKQVKRVLQFAFMKILTFPLIFGLVRKAFAVAGHDYEDAIADRVRNVAVLKKSNNLRFKPSDALLCLLCRRLRRFDISTLAKRTRKGNRLKELLGDCVVLPGQGNAHHDYWVFPILVDEPLTFVSKLREFGFDAANLPRSQAIAAPSDRSQLEPKAAEDLMSRLVVLPCYDGVPDRELQRMADAVRMVTRRPDERGSPSIGTRLVEDGT